MSIPAETRARVWEAVEALQYRTNAMAKGLRMQRSDTLGLVTDVIATTPYAVNIVKGAQQAAWAAGKILLLVNTGGDERLEKAALETMLERQVDGILFATMYHRPVDLPPNIGVAPAVLVDCYAEDGSLPSVVPDEVGGGRTATEHLLRKGHRRVAFINSQDPIPATAGRLQGYRQALAAFGVSYDDDLVVAEDALPGGGYRATRRLMTLPDPPTALFCFNDRTAMGAYDALRKLGLSIPGDVAVVGFDNEEMIAAHLHPSLTTLQLPHFEMGRWAVRHLLSLVRGAEAADAAHASAQQAEGPIHKTLDCPLIERDSS